MSSAATSRATTTPDEGEGGGVSLFGASVELTKPGITRLVTVTAVVALVFGGLHNGLAGWSAWVTMLVACTIGTALASGGANALNMWYEADLDARMERTKVRPIPSSRLSSGYVLAFGLVMCAAGSGVLWVFLGALSAMVALVTAASYVVIYTPLKTRTITNTLVGAVPGALPVLIGSCAVSGMEGFAALLDPIGLMLFVLMFVWQLPHFFAIAWMCRKDYEAGGFRMLPSIDERGNHTAAVLIVTSALLIPVTLVPLKVVPELAGFGTAVAGVVLGLVMVAMSVRFARTRSDRDARRVFLSSIVHLPVYLIVFVVEALARTLL